MNKRTIRKRFMRLDELALPAKEKMLPKEALREAENYKPKARIHFHRPATVALSIAAVIAIFSLVIVGVTSSAPKNIYTDISSVLDNGSVGDQSIYASADQGQSEDLKTNLPIVSCGKYKTIGGTAVLPSIPPGSVVLTTMLGGKINFDDLQDDVLYSVCFEASALDLTENEELCRLKEEQRLKRSEAKENAIEFIKKYAKEEDHHFLKYYSGYDYHTICEYIYNGSYEDWPGQETPEFKDIVYADEHIWDEYEEKIIEFERTTYEAVKLQMYEYLEGLGIEFYNKVVYKYFFYKNEIHCEEVYRVAFLTKEQIVSLEGGDNYGIYVKITYEELAQPNDDPVYLPLWFIVS